MAFKTNYIKVDGSINVDGSIYQFGQLFTSLGNLNPTILTITDISTTWNMNNSYNAKITLTKDISLNIINLISGKSGTLIVKQDNTGNRTIKLPIGSCKNNGWSLSASANSIDILSFLYDGSYYWNKNGPYT